MGGKFLSALMAAGLLIGPCAADTVELTGVIRDFKRGDQKGGHPDFQTAQQLGSFGRVSGLAAMHLSDDGKPVYNSTRPKNDTVYSINSFDQWFRDVPDVNAAVPLTLALSNGQDSPGGIYSYSNNAFWPINNKLFGNQGLNKNFHFTFELHTTFTYQPGQTFTFIGDDDVWVYVNGTRVIDIGGVHSAETGSVLLFDGKAFVQKAYFPLGNGVESVSSTMASQLASKWNMLNLDGDCPIRSGDRYVDLGLLAGKPDTHAIFNGSSVDVYATSELASVVLKFEDGLVQQFTSVQGTSGTFVGSGTHAGKQIVGVSVKAQSDTSNYGTYHTDNGASSIECTLDFFFAERHTTQSNFRIDTTMALTTVPPTVTSPLYD